MITQTPLPALRADLVEAAQLLRMSRAALYVRIVNGEIRAQKDGRRRYISTAELQRYIKTMEARSRAEATA